MKRVALMVLVCLFAAAAAQAAPIVDERFLGMTAYSALDGQAATGVGMTGNWDGDSTHLNVVPGGFVKYDRDNAYAGARSAWAATDHSPGNPFEEFLVTNGTTFYAGLHAFVKEDTVLGDDEGPDKEPGSAEYGSLTVTLDWNGSNDLQFGMMSGKFGVSGPGGLIVDAGDYVVDEKYLIVLCVEYNAANIDQEHVRLWINPIDESSATLIDTNGNFIFDAAYDFQGIEITGSGLDGNWGFFNFVKVGSSFADVLPEPATLVLAAVGGLGVLLRRKR